MVRSINDVISSMITYITGKISSLSTADGTVTKDVVINAPAQEFANVYTEINNVSQLASLSNYGFFTTDELNIIASDYGITRLTGTKSSGTIVFRFKAITDVNIPFGSRISTSSTTSINSIQFLTSTSIIVSSSQLSAYFNYLTNFYEVNVPIESVNTGAANNVSAGAINISNTSIPNLDSITNYLATTGGTDQESNQALANRIITKKLGNNIGTLPGYITTVQQDNRVIDAIDVGPNDPEMLRNEYGGSVDIYILGEDLQTATDLYTWTLGTQNIILQNQPVATSIINPITSIVGSTVGTLTLNTDFTFVQDTSLLAISSESQDKIFLTSTGMSKLTNGEQLTTVYAFNKLIPDLQSVINQDSNKIVASDILVREANEILVNVYMDVSIITGYNSTSVMNSVITVITDNINALKLNQDIQRSDLVAWAYTVPGLDKVNLTTLLPTNDVIANKTAYLRAGTITINVV